MYTDRRRTRATAAIAGVMVCLGSYGIAVAGTNGDCVNNGVQGSPFQAGTGNVTVTGGQVSGSGATLFQPFFLQPTAYNDWIDADHDGLAGNFASFPFVDNLAPLWPVNGNLTTHWMFQYRSIGSVNGFNEFVESQTCNAIPNEVPSVGLFNQFLYANNGLQWAGPYANESGTPVTPCEIEFAALDVPSNWALASQPNGLCAPGNVTSCVTDADCADNEKCVGAAKWNTKPGAPGYGLNPILSSTGYVSQLQSLSRQCGTCAVSGDPCTKQGQCASGTCTGSSTHCRTDLQCPAGNCSITVGNACRNNTQCPLGETCLNIKTCDNLEACNLAGPVSSLNTNTISPNSDTVFDVPAAWVPIVYIANRGSGVQNVKFSEMQYLYTTGRMPNGENLVATTRSVGSGTRNGHMNSTGIDTSWGRGDNLGNEVVGSSFFQIGPNTQPTNAEGSGEEESSLESRRLGVGYTGLVGSSRAIGDVQAGRYEILNVCKDVDGNGNPLCDCSVPHTCPAGPKFCSINTTIACTTNAECNPVATNGTCIAIDAAAPNNGYVRPSIGTVQDNCDPCCGYQIGGYETFVVRGNPNANRDPLDPRFVPSIPLDNQAVADFINNITDSTASFSGNVNAGECNVTRRCSVTTATDCNEDSDCPGGETCTGALKTCSTDATCTQKTCSITSAGCNVDGDCPAQPQTCIGGPGGNCSINAAACDVDGDCNPVAQTCRADFCKSKLNMPGQFLAANFFLAASQDCTQSATNGTIFTPTVPLNQSLQNYIRANNGLGVGSDTPAFGSVNPTDGGRMPIRNNLSGGARYTDGSTGPGYTYWNGSSFITNFSSGRLAARNKLVGDFNNDSVRDINDAAESVKAYYLPRTWQKSDPQATGVGSAGNQTTGGSIDNAIPELIGDYDSDGNLTKEDLRYFMDGLSLAGGQLNRKQGAIAIDNALATYGRCAGDNQVVCRIGVPADCTDHSTTGPCNVAGTYPWADPANQIEIPVGLGLDPKFAFPKDVNDGVTPFLATGKVYAVGDFRGDVAGRHPVAGAQPVGWDGFVDDKDIDYCCRMAQIGSWSELNDAVYLDLSCDMNGDLNVNAADVTELVEVILGTQSGDVNLDGVVDGADAAIINASISGPNPCNTNGTCGWADGDTNCDGFVNSTDLGGFLPPALLLDGTNVQKTRFISVLAPPASFATAGANAETALRIRLISLHHVSPPYTGGTTVAYTPFEGQNVWAGPPQVYVESSASGVRFVASQTGCTPHYRDWSQFRSCTNALQLCNTDADCPGGGAGTCSNVVNNTVHITGSAIAPSSSYEVENLSAACQGIEASCSIHSSPLALATTRWGDIADPFNPPSTTVQPNFLDVSGLIDKFKDVIGAPIKARSLMAPNDAFGNISSATISVNVGFTHIAACVDAFKGQPYPAKMGKCSGAGTASCTTAADCTSGGNTGPCNLYCP